MGSEKSNSLLNFSIIPSSIKVEIAFWVVEFAPKLNLSIVSFAKIPLLELLNACNTFFR